MVKAIVFGPTGKVASQTVETAHKLGAEVVLAMRDLGKAIPGLSTEKEKQGGFERFQADLMDPETVYNAVRQSGAKHAFVYVLHGHLEPIMTSIRKMKPAGIEFVVLLSSHSIQADDTKSIPQEDIIPYRHAQIEILLEETFGSNGFVAVRAGWFASNIERWKAMFSSGEVRLFCPDVKFDYIVPDDIGEVCGTFLARGLSAADGNSIVHLCGPELISQRNAVEMLGRAVNKEVKVTEVSESELIEESMKMGIPKSFAIYMVGVQQKMLDGRDQIFKGPRYEAGVRNTRKYTSRSSTTLQQWIDANKDHFGGN